MRDILFLVDGGVPWDVAVKLSPTRRLAFVVARGELKTGRVYDWARREWPKS